MFGLFKQRRKYRKQAEADAADLIARFGDKAYYEARDRQLLALRGVVVDGNRPADYWGRVRAIIGRKIGRSTLDTSTRYLEGE